jgi:hypothetical protein
VTRTSDTITAHVRLAGGQHRTLTLPAPEPAGKIRQAKPATIDDIDGCQTTTPAPRSPPSSKAAAWATARDGPTTSPWSSASSAPTTYAAAASGCPTPA